MSRKFPKSHKQLLNRVRAERERIAAMTGEEFLRYLGLEPEDGLDVDRVKDDEIDCVEARRK